MDILNNLTSECVIALGNFDGLHKAHMTIIRKCVDEAKKRGVKSAVLLFYEHPQNVINKGSVRLITTQEKKMKLLEKAGVDTVLMHHFDSDFRALTPFKFVEYLRSVANPVAICAGYDYRFGYKAGGDINMLRVLCRESGIDVIVTEEIDEDNIPVKSTAIRKFLAEGELRKANAMLGRPFSLSGIVEKGLQNGRKIGVPTANISIDKDVILPLDGVYAGFTEVDGKRLMSIINVGNNPTVNGKKITVESHILDFCEDIYGKTVEVEFCERIRGEIKFNGLEELKEQIAKDIEVARECI